MRIMIINNDDNNNNDNSHNDVNAIIQVQHFKAGISESQNLEAYLTILLILLTFSSSR